MSLSCIHFGCTVISYIGYNKIISFTTTTFQTYYNPTDASLRQHILDK